MHGQSVQSTGGVDRSVSRRNGVLAALVFLVILLIYYVLFVADPGAATSAYWNAIHGLSMQAHELQEIDTPDEALDLLGEMQKAFDGLSTDDVDQLAIDAGIRFRTCLTAANRTTEEAKWFLDHPIQSVVTIVSRGQHYKSLLSRLSDLKAKSLDAFTFSSEAHAVLTSRYPDADFATPFPPDIQPIEELELLLRSGDENASFWHEIGTLLGNILAALL